MGIAVRDDQGQFVTLTGNQIGCLLMDYVLSRRADLGAMPDNAAVVKVGVGQSLLLHDVRADTHALKHGRHGHVSAAVQRRVYYLNILAYSRDFVLRLS